MPLATRCHVRELYARVIMAEVAGLCFCLSFHCFSHYQATLGAVRERRLLKGRSETRNDSRQQFSPEGRHVGSLFRHRARRQPDLEIMHEGKEISSTSRTGAQQTMRLRTAFHFSCSRPPHIEGQGGGSLHALKCSKRAFIGQPSASNFKPVPAIPPKRISG